MPTSLPTSMSTSKSAGARRRRSVNLTIREDIMATAKSLGINASQAAETGLRLEIEKRLAERWLKENAGALNAHNSRIEKHGTLLTPDWAGE